MRNSNAHPLAPPTPAIAPQNGGELARGGGAPYGYGDNSKTLRSGSRKRVPEPLGITRELPGHWRSSKEVGGALAAETRTDAEEDEEDQAAWTK